MQIKNLRGKIEMKKLIKEFKIFITRGNVVDLSVGVIVGSAFTAIVTALSNNIIKPIINWVLALCLGSNSLDGIYTYLKKAYMLNDKNETVIDLANSIYIDWGAFLNAVINFLIIALVVFILVKLINKAKDLADVNERMTREVQKKLDNDKELTDFEQKWLNRYAKRYPDKAPKKTEKVVPEPEVKEPTETEKLLTEILIELKARNAQTIETDQNARKQ